MWLSVTCCYTRPATAPGMRLNYSNLKGHFVMRKMNVYWNWITDVTKVCSYFLNRHFLAKQHLSECSAITAFQGHTHCFPTLADSCGCSEYSGTNFVFSFFFSISHTHSFLHVSQPAPSGPLKYALITNPYPARSATCCPVSAPAW